MYRVNKNSLMKTLKKLDMEILSILDEKDVQDTDTEPEVTVANKP